ncbi:MAG: HlyC/CorC family transporter [Clostridia bacterium]|nr:HlyC/CorC family transporter [Clostridia bacterium]
MVPIMLASLSWQLNLTLSVVILFLIACSAFFSGCETAYTSVNSIRMKHYAEEKVKGARKAVWICDHYDITLSTILVGNNLVNIASTTICAFLFAEAIINQALANILNTLIMTIILLICGEITPKALSKQNPEKVALKFSGILFVIIKVLTPITFLFNKYQQKLLKKKQDTAPQVTEEELESIIDTMEEEGVIDSKDADLIQGVLDLDQKIVYNAMTPRVDVTAIEIHDSIESVKKVFLDTMFSRIPVYSKNIDNVVGVLSEKDFFSAVINNQNIDIGKLMNKPMFVNENMKLDDMIRKMQREKKHIAIVLDEHGGTSGIITLEDAIEEVWGEIYDEHDDVQKQELLIKKDDKTFIADAEIELEELFEKLKIEHLPSKNYTSLGAFLFELAEKVPREGQTLEFKTIDERVDDDANYYEIEVSLLFKLIKVENKRIRQVLIQIKDNKILKTQKS